MSDDPQPSAPDPPPAAAPPPVATEAVALPNAMPSAPPAQCRICRAPLVEPERVCARCQRALDRVRPEARAPLLAPPLNIPPPLPPPPLDYSFSLSTLMLAMTLIALLAGLCTTVPAVGIPLAIIALFAWVHTVQETRRLRISSPRQKIRKFLETFGLITAFVAASIGAIIATVFAIILAVTDSRFEPSERPVQYAYAMCVAAAAISLFLLARFISKVRERKRRDRFGNRL